MILLCKLQFGSEQTVTQCIMAASEGGFLEVTEAQNISAIGKCDVCRSDAEEAQIRCDRCKKWLCIDHIQVTRLLQLPMTLIKSDF